MSVPEYEPVDPLKFHVDRLLDVEQLLKHSVHLIEDAVADTQSPDQLPLEEDAHQLLLTSVASLGRIAVMSSAVAHSLSDRLEATTPLSNELADDSRLTEARSLRPEEIDRQVMPPVSCKSTSIVSEHAPSTQTVTQEKKPRRTNFAERGPLFSAIVPASETPEMSHADLDPINLFIVDDRTILLGDTSVRLSGQQLYVFNAMMLLRDRARNYNELLSLGYRSETESELSAKQMIGKAVSKLIETLEQAAGVEIIIKSGKTRSLKYVVNPALVLHDNRIQPQMPEIRQVTEIIEEALTPLEDAPIIINDPTDTDLPERAKDAAPLPESKESNFKLRYQAMTAIVQRFKDHPEVAAFIRTYRATEASPKRESPDEISNYYNEIRVYRLLDKDDETELFTTMEAGFALYDQLGSNLDNLTPEQAAVFIGFTAAEQVAFLTNLRLAAKIANHYRRTDKMPIMDIIQEANIGLSMAIARFDISKNYKFSTYATWWIKQSITRAMADKGRLIRVPVHAQEKFNAAFRSVIELEEQYGRPLTRQETEIAADMPFAAYQDMYKHCGPNILSLDKALSDEVGSAVIGDYIADDASMIDASVLALSDREVLRKLFADSRLSQKERLILGLRFELDESFIGGDGSGQSYQNLVSQLQRPGYPTLEEIGRLLGVTRERIRRIEQMALVKLQTTAQNQLGSAML